MSVGPQFDPNFENVVKLSWGSTDKLSLVTKSNIFDMQPLNYWYYLLTEKISQI